MGSGPLAAFKLVRHVARAQRGDTRAFRALYATLHPAVYGYLAARVRVRADAEDLTALTLHRFVDRLDRYDRRKGSVRAWVLTIARNALIDHLRAQRDVAPLSDVEHMLADARFAPDAHDEDPRLQRIRDALADHSPTTREMFALRYGDGLRTAEIAALLGLSEAAVKQRFSRTLRILKQRLATPENEEVAHVPS